MIEPAPADGGWDCHVHVFDATCPVAPGHYRPAHRPLVQIEAQATALGVKHLVLVQPSVYGTDNALLLRALVQTPGRHRGVVVLDEDIDDDALQAMHAAGVRGVRFNRVSPVGKTDDVGARFKALAPRLRQLGWHVQWYVAAEDLPLVARLHAGSGLDCVLDHLAGLTAVPAEGTAVASALCTLAELGAWVKLSGWYRLGSSAPYAGLVPVIRLVEGLFGARLLWGSDWPHTAFAADALPAYASLWQPVVDALGAQAAQALLQRAPAIYG